MKQNKDLIQTLRTENKQFRDLLTKLKKVHKRITESLEMEVDQSASMSSLPEFEKQNQKLCSSHKKYDELVAETKKREAKLKALCDQMEELQREQRLVKTNQEDSSQAKVHKLSSALMNRKSDCLKTDLTRQLLNTMRRNQSERLMSKL